MSGINTLRDIVDQLSTSPKIALAVSTATAGTGGGTVIDLIPDDIGKLASLVGIILSVVLIYTHLRRGPAEYKKAQLELKILKQKEAQLLKDAGLAPDSDDKQ